jgi:hypothetical protein
MSTQAHGELASFHQFVAIKLSEEHSALSPEEALGMWRAEHPAHEDDGVDDVTAAKAALADMTAGDVGVPLEEFDRQFRKEFGIDAKP